LGYFAAEEFYGIGTIPSIFEYIKVNKLRG
jgi:hypothetical protein